MKNFFLFFAFLILIPDCSSGGTFEDVKMLAHALERSAGERFDVATSSIDSCVITVELVDSDFCASEPSAGQQKFIEVIDLGKIESRRFRVFRPNRDSLPGFRLVRTLNLEARK